MEDIYGNMTNDIFLETLGKIFNLEIEQARTGKDNSKEINRLKELINYDEIEQDDIDNEDI